MTRSELEQRIAEQQPELSPQAIRQCVELILQNISEALVLGKRVEIRGFGSFGLRRRASRIGRNPRTGEAVVVPERHAPYFRPGRILRERINDARLRDNSTYLRLEEGWKSRTGDSSDA